MWWNMKKDMNWRKHEDKSNLIIPYEIVQYLHTTLKEFKASEQSPAMPARAKPMNPAGRADEGWARKPPKKGGGQMKVLPNEDFNNKPASTVTTIPLNALLALNLNGL